MGPKLAIGIDIGATTTKIGLVSPEGAISRLSTLPTAGPAPAFLEALADSTAALAAGASIAGIGVSVAGFVDPTGSAMFYNPNIAWLEGVPLRAELERSTRRRVILDADSNAACLAEFHFGVGRGVRRFFCLALGTGVGGGMIVDGAVVRLAHGGVGDIGHVIVDPFGAPCGSGCHGCAEATISVPGIEARSKNQPASVREIIDAARAGDPAAVELLAETGRLLAVAIASQAVILFPQVVAIAGGISEAGELLLAPARASLANLSGPFYRNNLKIEKAALGWQAPLAGSAVPFFSDSLPISVS